MDANTLHYHNQFQQNNVQEFFFLALILNLYCSALLLLPGGLKVNREKDEAKKIGNLSSPLYLQFKGRQCQRVSLNVYLGPDAFISSSLH